jgi:FAD/FMN-containing dehydrogenase
VEAAQDDRGFLMAGTSISAAAIDGLAPSFAGQLLREGDADHEQARKVWNGSIDRRPALIARCRTVDDVPAAARWGRDNGLAIAVRGGGRSAQGYGTCDDGLVVDRSPVKGIKVDPATGTAQAQSGLTWGEFDQATQEQGLAVTGGRFSTTGTPG